MFFLVHFLFLFIFFGFVASNTAYGFGRAVQMIAPFFDWNWVRLTTINWMGLVGTNKTYCMGLLISLWAYYPRPWLHYGTVCVYPGISILIIKNIELLN